MGIKVTNAELKSIIADVEAGLGELLKSETEKLQKASEESTPGEPKSEEAPAESAPEKESAPAESAPAEAPAESAPAESAPAPAESAPAGGDVPPDEAAVLAEPDHDALCQELSAMPPEHIKAVYLAAKAVLMQGAQQPAPAASPAPAAPAAAPAAPAASAPAGSPPPGLGKDEMDMSEAKKAEVGATKWEKKEVGATKWEKKEVGATKWEKGEVPSVPANGGEMKKSEGEAALAKALEQIETLQTQVQGLTRVAELTVGLPRQKAITGLSFVPKGEDLTKTETPGLSRTDALKKLSAKACDTKLSKSDREAINSFTLNPKADLSAVAHLLK